MVFLSRGGKQDIRAGIHALTISFDYFSSTGQKAKKRTDLFFIKMLSKYIDCNPYDKTKSICLATIETILGRNES